MDPTTDKAVIYFFFFFLKGPKHIPLVQRNSPWAPAKEEQSGLEMGRAECVVGCTGERCGGAATGISVSGYTSIP